ncbi:unnamed protein product [Protopolystoma xenopodis]|uniref:RING-type E3 ubiquitin transferase n=1 Tax=Protopolystoma xenopodis TaxID=117903 RepID=A0A3S5BDM8_9PLAT|nr:unnamed protein product [Protopolystoma xenopodis]
MLAPLVYENLPVCCALAYAFWFIQFNELLTSLMDLIQNSDLSMKEIGNRFFAAGQYEKASHYYTLAIEKRQTESCYFSNRALCFLQLQEYDKAIADCRRAWELNPSNLKAYFFAGQAYLALGNFDEALPKLTRAHNLALEQHINYGDEITAVIRLAKRKKFEALDDKRRQEEIELQTYLTNIIRADYESKCQAVKSQPESLLKTSGVVESIDFHEYSSRTHHEDIGISSSEPRLQTPDKSFGDPTDTKHLNKLQAEMQRRLAEVNDIFTQFGFVGF